MKKIFFFLLFLGNMVALPAQQPLLPQSITPREAGRMEYYLNAFHPAAPSSGGRPVSPVRTMAEWEEVQTLVITWAGFSDILTEIVRHAVRECRVLIITTNKASVIAQLENAQISLERTDFLEADFNTIWIRDYGPWTVYENDVDSVALVDWIYNRPRPKDDALPKAIAQYLGVGYYGAVSPPDNWVHTGGNHLRDGLGTAFSSDLVLAENPGRSENWLDSVGLHFLGINRYIKLRRLPFDGIHHLDMHMCLLDEETILVGEYPPGIADGPQIEANISYLRNHFLTPFGRPYRIVRVPMPPDGDGAYPHNGGDYRTYTNALFLNRTVLVPLYEEKYDTVALRIFRDQLPGYRVVGIDCNAIIPLGGAIHCITKLIGVKEPLWIAHPRLRDTYDTTGFYPVEAIIRHRSGIRDATLYYRTVSGGSFEAVPMILSDPGKGLWTAGIPAQRPGTGVEYYLRATALSGKEQVRPLPAPEAFFRFQVEDYLTPPTAGILRHPAVTCPGFSVRFHDDSAGGVEEREWFFPGGQPATSMAAEPWVTYDQPGEFAATLVVRNPKGADTLTLAKAIQVAVGAPPPVHEDFSGGPVFALATENPGQDAASWMPAGTNGCNGVAMQMDNFSVDTRFTRDYLRMRVDLSNSLFRPLLLFDVAYARRPGRADELRVLIASCNGEQRVIYNKTGNSLATVPVSDEPFYPQSCQDWRTEAIDLSDFAGETIEVAFENIGGFGNLLYLDNIRVEDNQVSRSAEQTTEVLAFGVFPNPARDRLQLDFRTEKALSLECRLWNALGQVVLEQHWTLHPGRDQHFLDIGDLPPGAYWLSLQHEGAMISRKVVVR